MKPSRKPGHDLGAVFDTHVAAEFATLDLEATMATMTDNPAVTHVPVLTGGCGSDAVREFYGKHFIGHWPADTVMKSLSRTVGNDRVVDELIMSFTHDVEMPAILPGVKPTGRKVELPLVVVVGFSGNKVAFERIYWDQASLLVQIGLLDPAKLPVTGVEQARRVQDPRLPSNELIGRG
jgi:carboxymethylenebutenolidase